MPFSKRSIVTKEQHDASVAKILEESPDHVIIREHPAEDVKIAEDLIDAKESTLSTMILRFNKGDEVCKSCGRQFNVLDVISEALNIHSKEFLNEALFGDKFTAGQGTQSLTCYECGTVGGGPMPYAHAKHNCEK
ncbi:hypothetical protein QBC42DRAFT_280171 [Cladorrhinum samala]|uniref:Uncharacterized protein n=1 Tax=Cladorrhinum samala TaxID=585594 RepID=A0AAV9H876_9PEZI|nr:hypothetical protein QBC42DRAFT_280171 [Cladorrhinum samala]